MLWCQLHIYSHIFLMNWQPYYYILTIFVSCHYFLVKYILSDTITVAMPALFWSPLTWNSFCRPLSPCVSLKLKRVSGRQHRVRSYAFVLFGFLFTVCLLIRKFDPLSFRLIFDDKDLLMPSYLLFSDCFVAPFLFSSYLEAFFYKLMIFCSGMFWFPSFCLLCIYFICGYQMCILYVTVYLMWISITLMPYRKRFPLLCTFYVFDVTILHLFMLCMHQQFVHCWS